MVFGSYIVKHVSVFHYFLWLNNIPLYVYTTFCSSVDGHLGHFYSGVFMNNATINIHVCVFVYHVTFVVYLGSDGKFLFYILRNCQLFS